MPVLEQLPILSDVIRVRLLNVLDEQELTVGELCDVLQLPQSTVSRHLKTLADANWVLSRREGTSRYYQVARETLEDKNRALWLLLRDEITASAAAAEDGRRLERVLATRRTRSEAFFSKAAAQWDRLREELFGSAAHLQPLLAWLDHTWIVGDLGCGTGRIAEVLAPFVGGVVAVDASQDMLEAARRRVAHAANVDLRFGTLEQLPIEDGRLDAACVVLVLHHAPDPGRVLAEVARVLRPGGPLLLVDMISHEREEYRLSMGHVWLGFSEAQLGKWLRAATFEGFRWILLPSDPAAKGPGLFVAAARKTSSARGDADVIG
ncbi:MAG: ArsR/SmtB family transcription factor [Vicinamibacterales bacterium]